MHGNASVVIVHDAMDNGQAEAGAASLCRKIRKKQLLFVAIGNAAARIGDFDDHAMRRTARRDANLAGVGRFDCVVQQIADRAANLLRIHEQLDLRIDRHGNCDAPFHVAIEARRLLQDIR